MQGMWGLMLVFAVGGAQAAVTDVTLDNGLRVIVQEDHRAPVMVSQVWYRAGSVDIIRDMAGGHIDLTFDQAITALSHIKSGTVKAFAVTQKSRLAAAPDIPSVDEAGAPGVYISTWTGLWVPAGTPKDIVERLAAAARETLADPAVAKRLADLGQVIFPVDQQTPAGLAAFHKAEIDKWWPIIKAAGVKAEDPK